MSTMQKGFTQTTFAVLALASLPALVLGGCNFLDGEPRKEVGLDGCRLTGDESRACFTRHLDVLYTDSTSDSDTIQHEVMTVETFVKRTKSKEIKVVSTSVASMKCPEIRPCFPLQTKTLVSNKQKQLETVTMSDLSLGDEVVVDWDQDGRAITSLVVSFAHRSDNLVADFVSLHTEHGSAIQGSSEHNIHVFTEDGKRRETSFGKLAEHVGDPTLRLSPLFVRDPRAGPVKIVSASWTASQGFVAPITEAGSLLVLAERAKSPPSLRAASQANWIQVSCFSTLPDNMARVVHHVRMLLVYAGVWSANENVDGVGTGYVMESVAAVGSRLGGWIGHTVTPSRIQKSSVVQGCQQPFRSGSVPAAYDTLISSCAGL